MTLSAAWVNSPRLDVLAVNPLGRALYSAMFTGPSAAGASSPNFARYNFLDTAAQDFYADWDGAADTTVALLRGEAGRHPHDKALRELVGELSTLSPAFSTRWSQHNVRRTTPASNGSTTATSAPWNSPMSRCRCPRPSR